MQVFKTTIHQLKRKRSPLLSKKLFFVKQKKINLFINYDIFNCSFNYTASLSNCFCNLGVLLFLLNFLLLTKIHGCHTQN